MKKILCISLIGILISSCKKEKTSTTITPDPSPAAIQNSPYTVSNATKFSGYFYSGKHTHSQTYNYTKSFVSFNDSTSVSTGQYTLVPVGGVILNNEVLSFDTVFQSYQKEQLPSGSFGNETWQIQGANGIPSFNYTEPYAPDCINFNAIPDSFSINAGVTFTLNITDISGTSSYIEFCDNSGHCTLTKPLYSGTNIISLTQAELSNFTATVAGYVWINLEHKQVLNFYGKHFQFTKARTHNKVIKINN